MADQCADRCGLKTLCQWALACVLLLCQLQQAASVCPSVCFCPSLSRNVYCSKKQLPFIPSGILSDTLQLNLNDNNFYPILSRANFTRFTDLEQLYLTECGIEYIEVDTFIDNKQLKWLDLGRNKLKTISDFTFRELTLDHLFLHENPGVKISNLAFAGLQTMGLYMQNNAMDRLSLEVLRPLNGSLKTLWLDGNKFELFHREWFYLFKTFSHLRLGENPLHCNCEARWMFDFFVSTSRTFEGGSPPSCLSPSRMRGKPFSELAEHDFRCQLPVFKNVDVIFEANLGKLTCLASGDPVPTIYWTKPDGESEVFIPKSEDISKEMEGVMYVKNPSVIFKGKDRYQCVASNPAGNVTFSINVAWPTKRDYKEVQVDQADAAIEEDEAKPSPEEEEKEKQAEMESKTELEKDKKSVAKDNVYVVGNASKSSITNIAAPPQPRSDGFSMEDIVGAVVGTFLLTLLACMAIFHVFYRHNRKMAAYPPPSVVSNPDIKRASPSRYEMDEHSMKMLEKGYLGEGVA